MKRALRRLASFTVLGAGLVLLIAMAPALLPSALLLDVVRSAASRRPSTIARVLCFAYVYLAAELVGLVALAWVWLASGFGSSSARLLDGTYSVQQRWASGLFRAACTLFSLRFSIDGGALATPGPVLVFIRHAALADTLLPTVFLTARHGLRLRFVLKKELLIDPCLEVAGRRLPNCFVDRSGGHSEAEVARVRDLARGLGPRDGVLIYPEGTRFTRSKRARALEVLASKHPELHARAAEFGHVLPPRLGGTLALVDACDADVVFFAHAGLEGFATLREILAGAMLRREVKMKLWRVARRDIPDDPDGRVDWLYREWARLDAWVAEHEHRAR